MGKQKAPRSDDPLFNLKDSLFRPDGKTWHLMALRSPAAHAQVLALSHPPLPDSIKLILPSDLPGAREVELWDARVPLLAWDHVEYLGEPVALLAGPKPAELRRWAQEIQVIFRRKPLVSVQEPQIQGQAHRVAGTPPGPRHQDLLWIEETYTTGAQDPQLALGLEVFIRVEEDQFYLSAPTLHPLQTLKQAQKAGGFPDTWGLLKPQIRPSEADARAWFPTLLAAQASAAAAFLGKNVVFHLSREEEFKFGPKTPESRIHLRTAVDPQGRLQHLEAQAWFNVGAYALGGRELMTRCLQTLEGIYQTPSLNLHCALGSSHTPPRGPWNSWGDAQALVALENHSIKIAKALGQDPLAWKLQNLAVPGPEGPSELLKLAARATDFSRKFMAYQPPAQTAHDPLSLDFPHRGISLTLGLQLNGPGEFPSPAPSLEIRLDPGNQVTVYTTLFTSSEALKDHWRGLAGEILGVPPDQVRFCPLVTPQTPDAGPLMFSGTLEWGTRLLTSACEALQKKRFQAPLPLIVRKVLTRPKAWTFRHDTQDGQAFSSRTWGVCVTELDLDEATSQIRVQKITLLASPGEGIHNSSAVQRVKEGLWAGLGWSYLESLVWEDHQLTQAQYLKQRQLPYQDRPQCDLLFPPSLQTQGPSGIGNLGTLLLAPGVLGALNQALGGHFTGLPFTRKSIDEAQEPHED